MGRRNEEFEDRGCARAESPSKHYRHDGFTSFVFSFASLTSNVIACALRLCFEICTLHIYTFVTQYT
jgi:hypothetical protein